MHFLLALLFAARIGAMGLTVLPPDGWIVVSPAELPTPPPFNRVVVLRKGIASVQVSRTSLPQTMRQKSPVELLSSLLPGGEPASTTIAGLPAARRNDAAIAIRGDSIYLFVFTGDETTAFDAILKSAELSDEPTRIEANGLSLQLPDGWRQVSTAELDELRPKLNPQNKLQQQVADDRGKVPGPPLVMKHDTGKGTMSASVQADRKPIPPIVQGASSIGIARMISAQALATYRGTIEVEPHEITISGMPSAEFVQRYTLVETNGSHEMKTHMVFIARKDDFYLIGYVAPADDAEDAKVFRDVVLKSVKIAK
jgi:hypothetical protein